MGIGNEPNGPNCNPVNSSPAVGNSLLQSSGDGCRKHHQAMYNRVRCKVCREKKNVQHEMYRRYRKIALAQNIEGKLRNWARLDACSGQTCVRLELEGPNNKAFQLENAFF